MENKILITGCAGFIGYHLTKSLLDDGYLVLGIDNINDYYDIELKKKRLEILSKISSLLTSTYFSREVLNLFGLKLSE